MLLGALKIKCYWMLVTGYWMLVTGYWILDTGYWILDARYPISDIRYSIFDITLGALLCRLFLPAWCRHRLLYCSRSSRHKRLTGLADS